MGLQPPYHIKTIAEFHKIFVLPKPQHPLISVVRYEDVKQWNAHIPNGFVNNFYSVALKKTFHAKMKYGQQEYDFEEGILAYVAPGQVINIVREETEIVNHSGWLLLIHPDFLWNTALAKKIKQYDYFGYQLNEALHLSEKEEIMLINILNNIEQEYNTNIDKFSQEVMIAQLEMLFTYSERFYQRQFVTRKITNHTILERLESLLSNYFKSDDLATDGLPTVQYISKALNISPNYLSRLLTTLTGQSTQQFIHDKLIELAKEKLSGTDLSINEIAYELGFEHAQSFSNLFKKKIGVSPITFRASFN